MEQMKEHGNACMACADYVNAMKFYSQAIAMAPKDASLYSNRSFAFLKLGMPARALCDADDCIRLRPTWAKGHFRRAEAFTAAGLHEEAYASYENGSRLDPADDRLRSECMQALQRRKSHRRRDLMKIGIGALVGFLLVLVMLMAPSEEGSKPPSGVEHRLNYSLSTLLGIVFASALGALGGLAATKLQAHARQGAALPPLESNERFAAAQMRGDRGVAGELRATSTTAPREDDVPRQATQHTPPVQEPSAKEVKIRQRSTKNGRAAALKALGGKR